MQAWKKQYKYYFKYKILHFLNFYFNNLKLLF